MVHGSNEWECLGLSLEGEIMNLKRILPQFYEPYMGRRFFCDQAYNLLSPKGKIIV